MPAVASSSSDTRSSDSSSRPTIGRLAPRRRGAAARARVVAGVAERGPALAAAEGVGGRLGQFAGALGAVGGRLGQRPGEHLVHRRGKSDAEV